MPSTTDTRTLHDRDKNRHAFADEAATMLLQEAHGAAQYAASCGGLSLIKNAAAQAVAAGIRAHRFANAGQAWGTLDTVRIAQLRCASAACGAAAINALAFLADETEGRFEP